MNKLRIYDTSYAHTDFTETELLRHIKSQGLDPMEFFEFLVFQLEMSQTGGLRRFFGRIKRWLGYGR